MALTIISSKTHFYRPNTHGQHPSPNIPPPVAAGSDCPPAVKKTLRLMHQRGLFGQDCIQLYFTHLIRNCRSDNTIRSYQTALLAFIGFLKARGKHHIETTTRDDISAYVEYEQDRGLCANSVNTESRLVYSFLQFLADRDVIHPNVLHRKIRVKVPERLPRAIDPEDIQSLLAVINQMRDRAMILLLLRTGMRIGELLHTRLDDVNLNERRIEIFEAQKNRVGRVVYISEDAMAALKRALAERDRISDFVFYGHRGRPLSYEAARCIFQKYLTMAGLAHKGYTLHALRHTFASELLNAGMRLECLQQLLGHSSIEMTRRYARLTDNTRREEYFRAMQVIESEGIRGHYRRDCSLPALS
jgi:integrase/recombinase XerD